MTAGANVRAAPGAPGAWVELTVRLALADAELVADALGAMSDGGVALEPRIQPSDDVDFAYELEPAGATVRAFLPAPLTPRERRALRRRLAALPLRAPLPRLRYRPVEDLDWSAIWREHFTALRVGRLVVHPSWEPAEGEALAISLDPGRAFGTGQHATTRLCLAAIERECGPGDAVLDLGTGSGILALAAARLGAARVDALDTDPDAVEAARENARRNGLEASVRVSRGTLDAQHGADGAYDLMAANISAGVVCELLPAMARALRAGGRVIVSGFMDDRVREVVAAARGAGLLEPAVERDEDGEWCAVVARKAGP